MRFPNQDNIQSKFSLYSFSSLNNETKASKSETYNARSKKHSNFNEYLYSHKKICDNRNDETLACETIDGNHQKHYAKSMNDKMPSSLPPKIELRLKLLSKIGECRSRNLISKSEEQRFMNLLSHTRSNDKLKEDHAVLYVRHELDKVILKYRERHEYKNNQSKAVKEEKRHQKKSVDMAKKKNTKHSISSMVLRPHKYLNFQHHSVETHQIRAKTQIHHYDNSHGNTMDIIELQSADIPQVNQETIEKLFVEMCFFARFGFAQPPCCLSCAYAMGKATNDENENPSIDVRVENKLCDCSRLIIWRKDANLILSPENLKSNILLLSCKAAKCLLKGGNVKGWRWNSTQGIMVTMS